MIDRKLIHASSKKEDEITASKIAPTFVMKPLEKAIVRATSEAVSISRVLEDAYVFNAADEYKHALESIGYLFSGAALKKKTQFLSFGFITILGVMLAKIEIAMSRGHTNVGFLLIAGILFSVLLGKWADTRITKSGQRCLDNLKTLLNASANRLLNASKERIESLSSAESNELALLASVYGISILPEVAYPQIHRLFKRAFKQNSNGSASCGSSCGSSCGGGGCGGGCGGCGS